MTPAYQAMVQTNLLANPQSYPHRTVQHSRLLASAPNQYQRSGANKTVYTEQLPAYRRWRSFEPFTDQPECRAYRQLAQ